MGPRSSAGRHTIARQVGTINVPSERRQCIFKLIVRENSVYETKGDGQGGSRGVISLRSTVDVLEHSGSKKVYALVFVLFQLNKLLFSVIEFPLEINEMCLELAYGVPIGVTLI